MSANDTQVGGEHYKHGEHEEHWDRAWRLNYDPMQYIITKWVERWRSKGGLEDLKKARHAIDKYIELVEADLENDPGNFDGALYRDPLMGDFMGVALDDMVCSECDAGWDTPHELTCMYHPSKRR